MSVENKLTLRNGSSTLELTTDGTTLIVNGVALSASVPITFTSPPSDYIGTVHPSAINSPSPRATGAANRAIGCRVIAPKAGFIRDLYLAVGVASGNIDIGIYDTGDTTTTVRTLKGHSGSIACPTAFANTAAVVWDPGAGAIPCTAGQQFEFMFSADNITATFVSGLASSYSILPTSHWVVPGGVLPKICGLVAAGAFPLPATIAEGSYLTGNQGTGVMPFICGRVSPT